MKLDKIILYHGSPNKVVVPQYGLGEGKHDYGKGFYLTENVELASEQIRYEGLTDCINSEFERMKAVIS